MNLEHCKGCGICATECPKDAIEMKNEGELKAKERQKSKAKGKAKVG